MLDARKGWNKGDPSPHNILEERIRDAGGMDTDLLDHELLLTFLEHHLITNEPIDPRVLITLVFDLEFAMSGRNGQFFRKVKRESRRPQPAGKEWGFAEPNKRNTKNLRRPATAELQGLAVECLAACMEKGWFDRKKDAELVIYEACGVKRATLKRWEKEYPSGRMNIDRDLFSKLLEIFRANRHLINPEVHSSRD